MVAVELVGPDGITPDKAAAGRVAAACHAQGVVVLTAGTYGNVVRLLPPLVIPDDLLEEGLAVLEDALAAI
jgi:4-aminobutyrate aminotransferase/(S)-3-amino-2-methylpropionate transaminase